MPAGILEDSRTERPSFLSTISLSSLQSLFLNVAFAFSSLNIQLGISIR